MPKSEDITHYTDKLTDMAAYTAENGLTWNNIHISDFMPFVQHKIILHTDNNSEEWCNICILAEAGLVKNKEIKISEIENINWFGVDKQCILNPDCAKASMYLTNIIQYMLSDKELETVHRHQIEKPGWSKSEIYGRDIYCYNTGNRLILPQNIISANEINHKKSDCEWVLREDMMNYTEEQATQGIINIISIYKNAGLPILSFTIAALLKSLLRECGVPPKFVLYVCGQKDRKKTAYISLLSPIFNRYDDNVKLVIQFNSSTYSADSLMNDYPDSVIILDNVYLSEDSDINKRIKKKFEEDVQSIGDDIGKRKADKRYRPLASIIATGEYDGIGNPSTITRYLTIPFGDELKESENEQLLHEYQRKPLIVSTWYYYFLQWAVNNAENIKESIKDLLKDFREISGNINMSGKLKEQYFVMLTSYMLFLEYCNAKKFIDENDMNIYRKDFADQLLRICYTHNKTVTEKEEKTVVPTEDFFRLIKYWYENNMFDLAANKNEKKLKNREALIYDRYLCLRTKALMEKINRSFPSVKLKDVIAQLVAKRVLKSDADKNTAKIKGLRFLKIPLIKLK